MRTDLAPWCETYLKNRGVSEDVIAERGYYTATKRIELADMGFGVAAQRRVPALVIPIHPPHLASDPAGFQIRPEIPRRNTEGKPLKFEFPTGAKMHLDVHPRMLPFVKDHTKPLLITEGVVKGDAAVSRLDVCTVSLAGVWNWRDGGGSLDDWDDIALKDRAVIIAFDSDVMLKTSVHLSLSRLGALLERRGAGVRYCYLPAGEHGAPVGLDDWLVARPEESSDRLLKELGTLLQEQPLGLEPDGPIVVEYEPPPKRTLADVDDVFTKWLADPDLETVRAVLGAVMANRASGDPVWLLVIAPPSSGKTETIMPLSALPDVIVAGVMTLSSLLSGTSSKERTPDATGGLLCRIGDRGILVNKDFGTVLAMPHEPRAQMLQALGTSSTVTTPETWGWTVREPSTGGGTARSSPPPPRPSTTTTPSFPHWATGSSTSAWLCPTA